MVTDNYGNLVDATTAEALSARLDVGDERMTRIEGGRANHPSEYHQGTPIFEPWRAKL